MWTTIRNLTVLGTVACNAPSEPQAANDATDAEAETCLRTKIWEMNREGWSVRNFGTVRLKGKEHNSFAVNLYTSREYKMMACGIAAANDVGLQLYDANGERLKSAEENGRQPVLEVQPQKAGQHFVVIHNRQGAQDGSISWTVLYR